MATVTSRGLIVAEIGVEGVGIGITERSAIIPARVNAQVVKKPKAVCSLFRELCILV